MPKLELAVLGAVLGFLASYVLDRIKTRREPNKRLSWYSTVERALVEVPDSIRERVSLQYDGQLVDALTHLRCVIANTGNRVVKDHELRFTMPQGSVIVGDYLSPEPEPELGVEQIFDPAGADRPERRYRIAHLERGESVSFNFVVAGNANLHEWKPRSFNAEGDVAFARRDNSVAVDDAEHIRPFLLVAFFGFVASIIVSKLGIVLELDELAVATVYLLTGAFLLPHLLPVARTIEKLTLLRLRSDRSSGTDIQTFGESTVVLFKDQSSAGGLKILPRSSDELDSPAASVQSHAAPGPRQATEANG